MIEYLIIGEVLMYWVICTSTFKDHINSRSDIHSSAFIAAVVFAVIVWPVMVYHIFLGIVKAIKESTNGD